ncbi:MAG: hypothetical protein JST92_21265 [Deltaproteobacteria bacterium]|nr:hypothetical protein [Deltaproteobacteria bacterium]
MFVSLVALALACATAPKAPTPLQVQPRQRHPVEPQTLFPSREEVNAMAAQPAPQGLPADPGVNVTEWKLAGPLPDRVDDRPHNASGPFESLVALEAQKRSHHLSEAAQCMAREFGKFFLVKKGLPADDLRRFIQARCGYPGVSVNTSVQAATADPRLSEEKLVEQFSKLLAPGWDAMLFGDHMLVGGAFTRAGKDIALVVVTAPQPARLNPMPMVPAQPDVEVACELNQPADLIAGVANLGAAGVMACTPDPTVKPPKFSLLCPTDRADGATWVEVYAKRPRSVLVEIVLQLLLFPAGAAEGRFVQAAPPANVPAGLSIAPAFVVALNQVRAAAKLPPVVLAPAQSALADKLAPHSFASRFGSARPELAERIALGLVAGWELTDPQPIEIATLNEGILLGRGGSGAALLAQAMARPTTRESLLDPGVSRIAMGITAGPDHTSVAAIIAAYRLHEDRRSEALDRDTAQRLALLRQRKELPPVRIAPYLNAELDSAVDLLVNQRESPIDSLNALLERASEQSQRGVHGFCLEAPQIDDLEFPDEFFRAQALSYALRVAFYRPPGSPWGRYAVFLVHDDGQP